MLVLAIDTSTRVGGIAIVNEKGVISEIRLNVSIEYSERLLPEIDHLLKLSGISINDIELFAISKGPGSFTGLRVGMSTVKGLAFATGRPVVTVSTLEALAWNIPFAQFPVCPVIDARKGEVFTALFRWNKDHPLRLMDDSVINRTKLKNVIKDITGDERFILIGDGTRFYMNEEEFIIAPPERNIPSPACVGFIGLRLAEKCVFENLIEIIPAYLRRSQAEEKMRE